MRTRYSALLLVLSLLAVPLYADIYVDDNAPGDPVPFDDRRFGDPNEDGSAAHPFDSIQRAIDAAVDGDTVIVAPGRYLSLDPWQYGEINFKGKNIRLVGSAPTDFSVVEKTILCGVVIFRGDEGPDCLLQGFKIQNHTCGGILGNGTQASISHCIISGNGPCGGTVVKDCYGPISNCLIVNNTTFHDCGVLPVMTGCSHLVNCTIADNLSGIRLVEQGLTDDGRIRIHNCIISGNQGSQVLYTRNRSRSVTAEIDHCLIENWDSLGLLRAGYTTSGHGVIPDGDPCFVQPGYWAGDVLVEGDYHLQSEGWRWSEQELHGSHWYFDPSTSCAVDAGDPMDSLGEEFERAPDDPEGQWGGNHAIDLGAYGGTEQASLAPNSGRPLGVAAVDLRDYWDFDTDHMPAYMPVDDPEGSLRQISVTGSLHSSDGFEAYKIRDSMAPVQSRDIYCVYADYALYTTQNIDALTRLPQISEQLHAQYPQYLTIGSTVQTPVDLFVLGAPATRPAVVVRGTLAEVITGTGLDLGMFVYGAWHDVIAFREKMADGAPGAPITIFARGFGPLMLGGQPVAYSFSSATRRR